MSEDCLEEIIYTSKKQEFIGKLQMAKTIRNYIKSLEDCTKNTYAGLRFTNIDNSGTLAQYNTSEKTISVDIYNLYGYTKRMKRKNDLSYLSCNLEIVQTIFHEVEHMREDYKKAKNEAERIILTYGNQTYAFDELKKQGIVKDAKEFSKIYSKNWKFFPIERIAEMDSYSQVLMSILNYPNFKEKYNKELDFIANQYIKSNFLGYNYRMQESSALMIYLKLINKENVKDELEQSLNDDSLFKTIRCGLPITRNNMDIYGKYVKQKILTFK